MRVGWSFLLFPFGPSRTLSSGLTVEIWRVSIAFSDNLIGLLWKATASAGLILNALSLAILHLQRVSLLVGFHGSIRILCDAYPAVDSLQNLMSSSPPRSFLRWRPSPTLDTFHFSLSSAG